MLAQISAMELRIKRGSGILALPNVIEDFTVQLSPSKALEEAA
jgi:hypothetical protein